MAPRLWFELSWLPPVVYGLWPVAPVVYGWVGSRLKIKPLSGHILQAWTCKNVSLSEIP